MFTAEYRSESTSKSRSLGEMEVKSDPGNALPSKDATRAVENINKRDYDNKQHS